MKVLISVVGRFHAFDLAKQMKRYGVLYKLNSTYPKYLIRRWGFINSEIHSNFTLEFIKRYLNKVLGEENIKKIVYRKQSLSNKKFLTKSDFIITWSGASLEVLNIAKKNKVITILERGSSHYLYQMNILQEEYSLYNRKFKIDHWVLERELQEYELADYISIPSTFVKNTFLEYGVPEEKLIVNPYGVDLSSFRKVDKTDNVFRIITTGNLSIRKGTKYLLEVFDKMNLPNAELWHLGSIDEDMKEWLVTYSNKNVHFLGHMPQDELYKYYSQGSVFCLMSLEEGLAMVQLQAMACGLPLIISTNTGGSDLISEDGKEGYVINIRDTDQLKTKLKFLYDNPKIVEKMSKAAIDRVKSGFTWKDYGDRYFNALRKIKNCEKSK